MSGKREKPDTLVLECDVPGCKRQQSFQNGGRTLDSCRRHAVKFGWFVLDRSHSSNVAQITIDVCPYCCSTAVGQYVAERT